MKVPRRFTTDTRIRTRDHDELATKVGYVIDGPKILVDTHHSAYLTLLASAIRRLLFPVVRNRRLLMTRGLENTASQIRGRLIDSALVFIDRDGIDGARLRDIVEHADMTTGSLYWFFKNRRALINAALAERYVRKMRQLTDAAEDIIAKGLVIGDPLDLLAEIAVRVGDPERVMARRESVQVLAAALDDPILAKHVADVQRTLLAQLTNVVRIAQEKRIIRSDVDAYSVAVMIQSTTVGLASVDLAPDLLPRDDNWIYLMERVVKALRASPDPS